MKCLNILNWFKVPQDYLKESLAICYLIFRYFIGLNDVQDVSEANLPFSKLFKVSFYLKWTLLTFTELNLSDKMSEWHKIL